MIATIRSTLDGRYTGGPFISAIWLCASPSPARHSLAPHLRVCLPEYVIVQKRPISHFPSLSDITCSHPDPRPSSHALKPYKQALLRPALFLHRTPQRHCGTLTPNNFPSIHNCEDSTASYSTRHVPDAPTRTLRSSQSDEDSRLLQ